MKNLYVLLIALALAAAAVDAVAQCTGWELLETNESWPHKILRWQDYSGADNVDYTFWSEEPCIFPEELRPAANLGYQKWDSSSCGISIQEGYISTNYVYGYHNYWPWVENRPAVTEAFALSGYVTSFIISYNFDDIDLDDWDISFGCPPSSPVSMMRSSMHEFGHALGLLKQPLASGQTSLVLSPLEVLSRLAALVPPPRRHGIHCYGELSAHAKLRKRVVETAGPSGAVALRLRGAARWMGITPISPTAMSEGGEDGEWVEPGEFPRSFPYMWAMLLARIYESFPLVCPRCGNAMRIIMASGVMPVISYSPVLINGSSIVLSAWMTSKSTI